MSDRELLELAVKEELKGKVVRFCSELTITPDEKLLNTGVVLVDMGVQYSTLDWTRIPVNHRNNSTEQIVFESGHYYRYDMPHENQTLEECKKSAYNNALTAYNRKKGCEIISQ